MNPVFWLIVVLFIIGVWFFLVPLFKGAGGMVTNLIDKTKNEIKPEEENESEE